MKSITRLHLTIAAVALSAGISLAQNDNESKPAQPKNHDETTAPARASQRIGDPYPFDTCPITGKKLGSMGDPLAKVYDGREVRFCCPACTKKFENDKAGNLAKLDEKIVKDQGPLYPLKASLVTGNDLPAKPFELVHGNRLIRLGATSEKAEFLKDPQKYVGKLDKATIAEQGNHYPLAKCPVSGKKYGGDMGDPKDVVFAGRLIRLCCNDCKKDLEKAPAKYIAQVDATRKGDKEKPGHDHKDGNNHKPHDPK